MLAAETSSSDSGSHAAPRDRALSVGWAIGLLAAGLIVLSAEVERASGLEGGVLEWLFDMNVDSTPFALLLLVLPVVWCVRAPILSRVPQWLSRCGCWLSRGRDSGRDLPAVLLAVAVGLLAYGNCQRLASTPVGTQQVEFGSLPPAFHDEFSYLFQAETLKLGQWSTASHPQAARLFDQMHVLNEGRFASRYFPGTGLWIVGCGMLGAQPLTAYWIATALIAAFAFAIGRELSNNGAGLLAGLLVALSPGIGLFGNLILGHQPTLVGLSVFVGAFLRLQRKLQRGCAASESLLRGTLSSGLVAGSGLAFAMLCRPMTAAGVGLPFGVWLAVWIVRRCRAKRFAGVVPVVSGFAVPLAIGFGVLIAQNVAITGRAFKSPYSLYTELFTPRHMYGFNNVERAQPLLTERVLEHYDQWAENLTLTLAAKNVGMRTLASSVWTLGLVALVVSVSVFGAVHVTRWRRGSAESGRWLLILSAILSLHVAHVPYWYDGIMHWHYVFESAPLLCLIAAESASLLCDWFRRNERQWMTVWWGAVLTVSVMINQIELPPFWPTARVQAGLSELAFAKLKHADFRNAIARGVREHPALVLVKHDPSDRHIDYVLNSPTLAGPVLIGRLPAAGMNETETLRLAASAFPERTIYVLDIPQRSLNIVRAAIDRAGSQPAR